MDSCLAQQPGITDTEIKFGNIMPYSGPASALSVTGKGFAGYFDMINEKGGVNGRKLNMVSLDDGFSPPKTVEATRRLVENDGVAFMFGTMGTAPSSATAKYLNGAKVPHLFLISIRVEMERAGHATLADGAALGAQLCRGSRHRGPLRAVQESQRAFCGALSERRCRKGLSARRHEALGADADKAIALATSFEVADPTVDSQVLDAREHQGRRVPDLQRDAARLRAGDPQGA